MIPLGYALLGLLARAPSSGYDLIRRMENPVGFFWHAQRSQIYPELARLEASGMVEHTVVQQWDRPAKKVYSITEAGTEALRTWAGAPMKRPPERDEFMLKVYSIWLADPRQARDLFASDERHHVEQLARYEEIRAGMERDWPPEQRRFDSPKFAAYATLLRGIEYERGYITWCRTMLEAVAQQVGEQR